MRQQNQKAFIKVKNKKGGGAVRTICLSCHREIKIYKKYASVNVHNHEIFSFAGRVESSCSPFLERYVF